MRIYPSRRRRRANRYPRLVELHIEQGCVLASNGGVDWRRQRHRRATSLHGDAFNGESNHAGTTPMGYQDRDTVHAFSRITCSQSIEKPNSMAIPVLNAPRSAKR